MKDNPLASSAFSKEIGAERPSRHKQKCLLLVIALFSLSGVILSTYPIIFLGKSFVSPCSVGELVYPWWPPIPGGVNSGHVNQFGSDTGALMWFSVPKTFVEADSVYKHGEIPLWDRHSAGGSALIGQGISMLGDPLHWIVILGHGSAWAWDLKFLTAKILFALGFAFLILQLLKSIEIAIIYAVLSAYCAAYFGIANHPAYFVFSYSPWILLSLIKFFDSNRESSKLWGGCWLIANIACFGGGHIEPAVVIIAGLNAVGLTYVCAESATLREAGRKIMVIGIGTGLFFGLTAPTWVPFITTLSSSWTFHETLKVTQFPISNITGIFDNLFDLERASKPDSETLGTAPGTSLLISVGAFLAIGLWRKYRSDRFFWINLGALGFFAGCVYGWVPGQLIAMVPMLNRVGHTHIDFSYLVVIHFTLLSAYGFSAIREVDSISRALKVLLIPGAILAVTILLYFASNSPSVTTRVYLMAATGGALGATFLFVVVQKCTACKKYVLWTLIALLAFVPNVRFGLYNFGNPNFLRIPGPRAQLDAPSTGIRFVQDNIAEPMRIVGLQGILIGDYSAVYKLEDIRSVEPLWPKGIRELLEMMPGLGFGSNLQLQIPNPIQAQPLLNLLNVKYLLAHPSTRADGVTSFQVVHKSDFLILENKQTWPRAFFSDRIVSTSSTTDLLNHLILNPTRPFASMDSREISSQNDLPALIRGGANIFSTATNYKLFPNSTEFDIHADSNGVVCLTESLVPEFTVKVNGEYKPLLRINHAFKGVYIDKPGDYQISFTYRPRYWTATCLAFGFSVIISSLLLLRGIPRKSTRCP